MYAEKAEVEKSEAALRFNCAQRKFVLPPCTCPGVYTPSSGAHANTLENLPYIITMSVARSKRTVSCALTLSRCRGLIWGLKQPVYSAILLEFWVFTRVLYTYGYINYGPKGVRTLRPTASLVSSLTSILPHSRGRLAPGWPSPLFLVSGLVHRGGSSCTDNVRGIFLQV